MKTFAYIGSWRSATAKATGNPAATGVHVFDYDAGRLERLGDYLPGCWAGCMLPLEGGKLYVTDELMDSKPGEIGGGGYVYSMNAKADGTLELIGKVPSYGVYPCFMALTMDRKYAVVPNHSTTRFRITKTAFENGEYKIITERDEANVVLFSVDENGALDKVLDIVKLASVEGKSYEKSTPHCVFRFPDTDIFTVIDNGADIIHRFTIDREKGKLCIASGGSLEMDKRSAPRYAALHPTQAYLYLVDEARTKVHTLSYNKKTGEMTVIQDTDLIPEGLPICKETIFPVSADPADIIIGADGRYVYATCRGVNTISVFEVGCDFKLKRVQNLPCGGKNPRSIAIDPDGGYLLCCNLESDSVARFEIDGASGKLSYSGETEVLAPGFVRFMRF